VRGTGLHRDR